MQEWGVAGTRTPLAKDWVGRGAELLTGRPCWWVGSGLMDKGPVEFQLSFLEPFFPLHGVDWRKWIQLDLRLCLLWCHLEVTVGIRGLLIWAIWASYTQRKRHCVNTLSQIWDLFISNLIFLKSELWEQRPCNVESSAEKAVELQVLLFLRGEP